MSIKKIRFNKEFLTKFCSENKIIYDKISDDTKINRDTIITGICNTSDCTIQYSKSFREIVNRGGPYCCDCAKERGREKSKLTNMKKLGVENPSQSVVIKEKKINTCLKNFGVKNPLQSIEIQEKVRQTCVDRYGVENPFQSKEVQEKIRQTCLDRYDVEYPLQSIEIQEKTKQTCLDRYDVEYPAQSEDVQEKIRQTCVDKYGVENPTQSKEVRDKMRQTCLEKYGVEYPAQSEDVQEKSRQTCLDRYGVTSVMHVPEIAEKCSKSAFTKKEYTLPSGNILQIQGYEKFALDELIKLYNEDDIINGMLNVPTIWYYDESGQKHRHYVDFFIPSKQLCIEVKSTWTAEKKQDNIFLKQNAGKTLGYQYEIWIYDSKGNKVECHD